jgi:hypothetical protein
LFQEAFLDDEGNPILNDQPEEEAKKPKKKKAEAID